MNRFIILHRKTDFFWMHCVCKHSFGYLACVLCGESKLHALGTRANLRGYPARFPFLTWTSTEVPEAVASVDSGA